jgi:hypothetical protein
MQDIYIIMEKVDLGGEPIAAYTAEAEAFLVCDDKNIYENQQHVQRLLGIGYTQKEADDSVLYRKQFYVQSVDLK